MLAAKKYFFAWWKIALRVLFFYFFWLMLRLTLEYIPARSDVSFLMIKQTEVAMRAEYLPIFYTHVYTSILVLLSSFIAILRRNFSIAGLHKTAGRICIILILFFSAPSGIYMGVFANGGFWSQFSFVILGILWWISTFRAYQMARRRQFSAHKRWMWRSFALTLSAVTLRMWKVAIVYCFHPNPMDVYQIIAWLGWVPNLLLVEILILKKQI